jgi:uncharacterized protein
LNCRFSRRFKNVPPFVRFLAVAGQLNGQVVNAQNIAREAAVARSTVDTYFAVLSDTLVGHILPAWRPGLKVREAAQPKFYWFDPGVARAAAGLLRNPADRGWQGAALETLIYHELRVYNEISPKQRRLSYYRTPAGVEVDFIVETAGLGRAVGRGWLRSRPSVPSAGTGPGKNRCGPFRN